MTRVLPEPEYIEVHSTTPSINRTVSNMPLVTLRRWFVTLVCNIGTTMMLLHPDVVTTYTAG